MNYQSKGIQLSFVVHAVFLAAVLMLGSLSPAGKPVVIDFSIESRGPEAREQSPEARNTRQKIRNEKQITGSLEPEPQKMSAAIPESPPVPLSDNQEAVPLRKEQIPHIQKTGGDMQPYVAPEVRHAEKGSTSGDSHDRNRDMEEKNRYMRENFSYIRDMIQKKLAYPRIARQMGWSGRVMVSFMISADGYAKDIKVTESSGFDMLDSSAVETVKKTSPFPRPPLEAQLIIPIVYRLN